MDQTPKTPNHANLDKVAGCMGEAVEEAGEVLEVGPLAWGLRVVVRVLGFRVKG